MENQNKRTELIINSIMFGCQMLFFINMLSNPVIRKVMDIYNKTELWEPPLTRLWIDIVAGMKNIDISYFSLALLITLIALIWNFKIFGKSEKYGIYLSTLNLFFLVFNLCLCFSLITALNPIFSGITQ